MDVTVISPIVGLTDKITDYSVVEDATPLDPASSAGGVGSISVTLRDFAGSPRSHGDLTLNDGARGVISGDVRSVSGDETLATLTADSVLVRFNTVRTVPSYSGTLKGAIQNFLNLVGISNTLVVSTLFDTRPVIVPGWKGDVWVGVKQFLSAQQVEMAVVGQDIVVRPIRSLEATESRATSRSFDVSDEGAARTVDITYYQNQYGTNVEFYPSSVEGDEPQIISVDANAVETIDLTIVGSVNSVNQPTMAEWVGNRPYPGTNGVYSVIGNDDLPITPAQWAAQGGWLRVETTDDPKLIRVVVQGANNPALAPFRIAMSSGSGNSYNSLHITGTGVVQNPQVISIPTGANVRSTVNDVGVTVENQFVSTLGEALSLGMKTAQAYAGINYTISGSAQGINRPYGSSVGIGITIAGVNAALGNPRTIASVNALFSGYTVWDVNKYWADYAATLYSNQMYGNAVGARIYRDDMYFRVTSVTTTPSDVSFNATMDVTVGDFNGRWGTRTIAQMNAQYPTSDLREFSISPLLGE